MSRDKLCLVWPSFPKGIKQNLPKGPFGLKSSEDVAAWPGIVPVFLHFSAAPRRETKLGRRLNNNWRTALMEFYKTKSFKCLKWQQISWRFEKVGVHWSCHTTQLQPDANASDNFWLSNQPKNRSFSGDNPKWFSFVFTCPGRAVWPAAGAQDFCGERVGESHFACASSAHRAILVPKKCESTK